MREPPAASAITAHADRGVARRHRQLGLPVVVGDQNRAGVAAFEKQRDEAGCIVEIGLDEQAT